MEQSYSGNDCELLETHSGLIPRDNTAPKVPLDLPVSEENDSLLEMMTSIQDSLEMDDDTETDINKLMEVGDTINLLGNCEAKVNYGVFHSVDV